MSTLLSAPTRRLVVILAVIGLLIGGATAFVTMRKERFVAEATLAMLPGPDVPPETALGFWEVLNRNQATRTAALTLEDERWVAAIAAGTNIAASEFELVAAAIPESTLVEVSVEANSEWAAERGLSIVLGEGVAYAERVSGPFKLETVSLEYAPAASMSPTLMQQIGAFALAGLLVFGGLGLLIGASSQKRRNGKLSEPQSEQDTPTSQIPTTPITVLRDDSSVLDQLNDAGQPKQPKRAR